MLEFNTLLEIHEVEFDLVRAIEKGTRKVWAIEFVLLGEIFRRAWAQKGIDVRPLLEEFLPRGSVVAGTVRIDGGGLRDAVNGHPFPPEAIDELEPSASLEPGIAARLEARRAIPETDPGGLDELRFFPSSAR